MRQLVKLTLYKISGKEVCNINSNNRNKNLYKKEFPEFCIREDPDGIIESEIYFQFFESEDFLQEDQKEKKYILFNIKPISSFIQEEFNQVGFDFFLEGLDLKNLILKLNNQYFNRITRNWIPIELLVVVDLMFEGEESFSNIIGYLDFDLNFIPIEGAIKA